MIKPDLYSIKTVNPEKMLVVKVTDGKKYKTGELVNFICTDKGYLNVGDEGEDYSMPYFEQVSREASSYSGFPTDKETMMQRLRYLKTQKEKADSVLNLKLKL